jgi:hypothetical protein
MVTQDDPGQLFTAWKEQHFEYWQLTLRIARTGFFQKSQKPEKGKIFTHGIGKFFSFK